MRCKSPASWPVRGLICVGLAILMFAAARACSAQDARAAAANDSTAAQSQELQTQQLRDLQNLVTDLARRHVPREYENNKKWGMTKEVVSGLSIRRDGLRIKTKRRRKLVNDGTWKRYRAELVNPEQELTIRISNVDASGAAPLSFDVEAIARLRVFGRLAQWERGVQLISLSADADATIRLQAHCEVALRFDPTKLPPDFLLQPKVTRADMELLDFRLYRLSDLHGDVAKQLGKAIEELLEEAIANERPELANKVNRQIAKKQGQLRLSLHDAAIAQWRQLSQKYLSETPAASDAAEKQKPGQPQQQQGATSRDARARR